MCVCVCVWFDEEALCLVSVMFGLTWILVSDSRHNKSPLPSSQTADRCTCITSTNGCFYLWWPAVRRYLRIFYFFPNHHHPFQHFPCLVSTDRPRFLFLFSCSKDTFLCTPDDKLAYKRPFTEFKQNIVGKTGQWAKSWGERLVVSCFRTVSFIFLLK